jgi:hypothetical protein
MPVTERPAGHLEPIRQLSARPVAARLEQGEELQEPPGGLGHEDSIFFEIEDRT